ncbi:uncharacterized protein LOC130717062 isoform X3 [Lotus japonicus]|uniref:uncharacterized protein LOC130717062 isoform X3 n=1 Tax=Lotus japonicus TaxID=34305 RepID=UPI002586106F|nr:uncharacterized protein LOC130717062 isoform X3 [Lotus japonicus]
MGLPQVSSGCIAEEVAASFVQTAPRIASISNNELNLLAGEEERCNRTKIHMPHSERNNVIELSKSHVSKTSKDGKSNIQKLKIDSMEQIARLSVNTEQTPTSRTVGFRIRASTPCVNGFGGNGYSSSVFNATNDATEASKSQVRKRLLSPLNGMMLADHFRGDPLDIGEGNHRTCPKVGDDCHNAIHEYKKVHIGDDINIQPTIWSSAYFQEFVNSSCNDSGMNKNKIVSSHDSSHSEHEESMCYKHLKSSSELNDSKERTKLKSLPVALSIPQKKVSSPRFPLSPLGKKSSTNEKLGGCRTIDVMLDDGNLSFKDVEESLDKTCQGFKSQLYYNSMQQKSDMFTRDKIIDMNDYWTRPASFPPKHANFCGTMSRLPSRRSLIGSFEESLLSGRLLSGKVSQVSISQKIEGFLAVLNVTGGNFSPQSQKVPFGVSSVQGDKYLLYYSSINLSGKLSSKSRVSKFQRTLSMDESRSEKSRIRIPMKGRIQLNIGAVCGEQREAHIRNEAGKVKVARKFSTKVVPRKMRVGDLVLRKNTIPDKHNKLSPNWGGPYRIIGDVGGGAYKLEQLSGQKVPRTWNASHLKQYFS